MGSTPARPARFLRLHHLFVALVSALVVALAVTGFMWAQKGVTVNVDGESRYINTQAEDVAGMLVEAGIAYSDADVVSPAPSSSVVDGMSVVVRHAIPVTLVFSGEEQELKIVGSTVADALIAAGVDPDESLVVEPDLSAPLESDMTITAANVFVRVFEEQVDIPFETVTRNDGTSASGTREIVTQGVPGTALRVFRVLVTDGSQSEPELIAERVVTEPVDEIVAVGTMRASTQVASRSSAQARPAPGPAPTEGTKLTVSSTAYAPGVDGVGTRTATGARAGYGIVAVDPSVIPLGTRLYIPGYGNAVAADTGGAIKGNKIDVCFNTRAEALAWGRRTVTITILP